MRWKVRRVKGRTRENDERKKKVTIWNPQHGIERDPERNNEMKESTRMSEEARSRCWRGKIQTGWNNGRATVIARSILMPNFKPKTVFESFNFKCHPQTDFRSILLSNTRSETIPSLYPVHPLAQGFIVLLGSNAWVGSWSDANGLLQCGKAVEWALIHRNGKFHNTRLE